MTDEKDAAVRRAARVLDATASLSTAFDASGVWQRIEELERERDHMRLALVSIRAWVSGGARYSLACDEAGRIARAALASSPSETEEQQ